MDQHFDSESLKLWFLKHKREFPWRNTPSPYAVWVSEVMLQQTQSLVVIPYFEKWMDRFPTITALAESSEDEVIKMWEGLGYYSRARNLHQGAKQIIEQFNGELPKDPKQLATIKGLGPYTIGAIRSFAFHEKAAAVDGNVLRVLTRYFDIHSNISKPSTISHLRKVAKSILPDETPWEITEGLIELGATICTKQPKCTHCPIKRGCQGHLKGTAASLPIKEKPKPATILYRAVAIIHCEDHILLKRNPKGKVMSDLYEFPYFEFPSDQIAETSFIEELQSQLSLNVSFKKWLPREKHGFTRYRAHLIPALFTAKQRQKINGLNWHLLSDIHLLPFSSGHKRIKLIIN